MATGSSSGGDQHVLRAEARARRSSRVCITLARPGVAHDDPLGGQARGGRRVWFGWPRSSITKFEMSTSRSRGRWSTARSKSQAQPLWRAATDAHPVDRQPQVARAALRLHPQRGRAARLRRSAGRSQVQRNEAPGSRMAASSPAMPRWPHRSGRWVSDLLSISITQSSSPNASGHRMRPAPRIGRQDPDPRRGRPPAPSSRSEQIIPIEVDAADLALLQLQPARASTVPTRRHGDVLSLVPTFGRAADDGERLALGTDGSDRADATLAELGPRSGWAGCTRPRAPPPPRRAGAARRASRPSTSAV